MAKYHVKFSCGHVQTVELFGKDKDRQRKIEYYEERGLCKDCYKALMQEIEHSKPLGVTVQLNPLNIYPFCAYFTGDTKPVKDKIKALGFTWTDIGEGGMFDVMSTDVCMGWSCDFKSGEDVEEALREIRKVFPEIEVNFDFNDVDMALFKKIKDQEAELQKKIDELEKPQKPDCYPKGYWNGRFYRSEKGYRRIYVDGKEQLISEEDGQAIDIYDKQLETYKLKIAAIKGDENAIKQLEQKTNDR